jgi:hypothetical protein
MKYLSMLAILVAVYALNGCSSDGFATSSSTGEKVPGEVKSAEENRLQPGAGGAGPNATVKW